MILDPHDPDGDRGGARATASTTRSSRRRSSSPVYQFVKEWKLALPLAHRVSARCRCCSTCRRCSPVIARRCGDGVVETRGAGSVQRHRSGALPLQYLATLFGAGNEAPVRYALRKQKAVRWLPAGARPSATSRSTSRSECLREAGCTRERGRGDLPADLALHRRAIASSSRRCTASRRSNGRRRRKRLGQRPANVDRLAVTVAAIRTTWYVRRGAGELLARLSRVRGRSEVCAARRFAADAELSPEPAGAVRRDVRSRSRLHAWTWAGICSANGYERGAFLARAPAADERRLGIEATAELPDHLPHVLTDSRQATSPSGRDGARTVRSARRSTSSSRRCRAPSEPVPSSR